MKGTIMFLPAGSSLTTFRFRKKWTNSEFGCHARDKVDGVAFCSGLHWPCVVIVFLYLLCFLTMHGQGAAHKYVCTG